MNSGFPVKPDTENYFRFYGIDEKFGIDAGELKQKYFQVSKTYHPDYYGDNPEAQNLALSVSAYNNAAYKTLSNEISRAQYLCSLKINRSEEKQAELPGTFLFEMMELNEAIDENQTDHELINRISSLREETLQEMRNSAIAGQWEQTEIAVLKWKYLERLANRLN